MATRGGRGGAPGGGVEGVVVTLLIVELGSPVFLENTMVVLSDAITQQNIMVRPPTKYLYRLNWGGRDHDGDVRFDRGGQYDGVISIFNKLNL